MKPFVPLSGLFVLAVIWCGPLLDQWRDSFAAHMLAHMGVITIAAPLIAFGLPRPSRPLTGIELFLPVSASVLELLAVWGWHAPAARALAQTSTIAMACEQATFLAVGVFLWWTSFGDRNNRKHAMVGAGALLLTSIHMTLLGALQALSPRTLYGSGDVTCFGLALSAAEDQQLGGIVMLLIGALVYSAGGLFLMARVLSNAGRGISDLTPGNSP